MTKRLMALALGLAMVGTMGWAEPYQVSISVTQAVQSKSLRTFTHSVTVVSDGASTCRFRLFTDVDTPGNATMADPSISIKQGESLQFEILSPGSPTTEFPLGVRDSESFSSTGQRARYYKSISAICAAGQTASWRVFAK